MRRLIAQLLAVCFATTLWAQAQVTIEAPSPDPTLTVRGPEKAVALINDATWESQDNYLAIFTRAYGEMVRSSRTCYTALQVDGEMRVTAVVNGGVTRGERPAFTQPLELAIPTGGFVLVASDASYASAGWKRFAAERFRKGDVVKLRKDGEVQTLAQICSAKGTEAVAGIELDGDFLVTVTSTRATVTGRIANYRANGGYRLQLVRQGDAAVAVPVARDGRFTARAAVTEGTNYMRLQLLRDGDVVASQPLAVYRKSANDTKSPGELVMWVEQFPNALTLTSREAVASMAADVKRAGFTAIGLDVKGPEGYVSYRLSDLTHSPYITCSKNPKKHLTDNGFDLLQTVLDEAHKAGLKVYTSFNFFTEGNITAGDYAVLGEHKDWEEVVQRPEDKGKLLAMSQSQRGRDAAAGKLLALAFVNPSCREVQDFQLLRVEEVLKNYDVDGVVLDRCRYDNLYADFSHTTRNAFADYLAAKGRKLACFPDDAFRIEADGTMTKGQHYHDWIVFRAKTIADFTGRVRQLVEQYKLKKNRPDLKMAAYVGSWYEAYYQNGVNWASRDFVYNDCLAFPESDLYGADYNEASYLRYLDFLMIGTYYKTAKEVNRYITLGNILTGGECPILGGMSLPDLKVERPQDVFAASLRNSAGLMIFDLCYVDWNTFFTQMREAFSTKKKQNKQ